MKDKENQIKLLTKRISKIQNKGVKDILFIDNQELAEELLKYYQPKLPKDSIVFSKEEYEGLKQEKLNAVCDLNMRIVELDNELKHASKETTEKIFDILYQWLDLENIEKYGFVTIQKFDFLRKFREIYKQFGAEIKE